ncbi:MAG: hypothetical protein DRJ10_09750 [Bacteroidetes bacterium]|nr:MAG: hypothetical protein DRJ10_09750 [Bacteroidota bacterium]
MNLKNLKIGTKLILGFGIVTLILVLLGFRQIMVLNKLDVDRTNMNKAFQMADAVMESKTLMALEMQYIMELIAASETSEINEWWAVHLVAVDGFDANIESLLSYSNDHKWGKLYENQKKEIRSDVNSLENIHNTKILPQIEKLKDLQLQYIEIDDTLSKKQILAKQISELDFDVDKDIVGVMDELVVLEEKIEFMVKNSELISEEDAEQSKSELIILIIIGFILSAVFSIVIIRSIVIPVNQAVKLTETVSRGDLTVTIDIDQKDEIGQLVRALNLMVTKLKNIMSDVHSGSEQIASASEESSSSSQEMSEGANEQASSIEEVSATMEEMTANMQQSASNAQQTEKISLQAAKDIKIGSKAVSDTVESMKTIADKISIITEIANQTNMLALNAAVEAARAGNKGKGFAVVATEVKQLAERSAKAAEEIDKVSTESVLVAENAGKMLADIVPNIEKTSILVAEISTAIAEQSSSSNQISNSIDEMHKVTQQNSAVSEELSSSAEELAAQADLLKETISFFKIDNESSFLRKKISIVQKNQKPIRKKMGDKTRGVALNLGNTSEFDTEFERY